MGLTGKTAPEQTPRGFLANLALYYIIRLQFVSIRDLSCMSTPSSATRRKCKNGTPYMQRPLTVYSAHADLSSFSSSILIVTTV